MAQRQSSGQFCFMLQITFCVFIFIFTCWINPHHSLPKHKRITRHSRWVMKNSAKPKIDTAKIEDVQPTYEPGRFATIVDIPKVKVQAVNCKSLFLGQGNAKKYQKLDFPHWHQPDEYYVNATRNCSSFIESMKYVTKPVSPEEEAFPLAFSLVVYKNAHQVEQLLRAIYRPQNYYCIHVDGNAKHSVYSALSSIAKCFPNVIVSSRRSAVQWGTYTVLEAEFNCMENLLNKPDWKYLINLTGQEFPLKTMLDIVRILKAYNGSNAIDFDHKNYHLLEKRIKYHYKRVFVPGHPKNPPPHNMTIEFGPVHVALTRGFVNFVVHSQVAADFKNWLRDTNIPDETFFISLHVNPQLGVPGAFTGDTNSSFTSHETYLRYKKWQNCKKGNYKLRMICILGVNYLTNLFKTPAMFGNKFLPDYQPMARMCLEELVFNRTAAQIGGKEKLDLTPYRDRSFVKQHRPS